MRVWVSSYHECNMNPFCPYCGSGCWPQKPWTDFTHLTAAFSSAIERLFQDEVAEGIVLGGGGEPATQPWLIHAVGGFKDRCQVAITTNLIAPVERYEPLFRGKIPVAVSASFHPHYWTKRGGVAAFAEKLATFRAEGCFIHASVVAYPPYLDKIAEWKQALAGIGTELWTHPFRGEFRGRPYPASYTPEEWQALWPDGGFYNTDPTQEGSLLTSSTNGRMCRAGQCTAYILGGGDVRRCPDDSYFSLGHVLRGDVARLPGAAPCMAPEGCHCAEFWKYLDPTPPQLTMGGKMIDLQQYYRDVLKVQGVADRSEEYNAERYDVRKPLTQNVWRPEGLLLYNLVRDRKPSLIVEFGTCEAVSTIYMAAAMEDNGHGRIITVDVREYPRDHIHPDLLKRIEFVVCDGLTWDGPAGDEPIDLLFEDGPHTYEFTRAIMERYAPRIRKPRGLICVHDVVQFPDVCQAARDGLGQMGEIYHFNPGAPGIGVWRFLDRGK